MQRQWFSTLERRGTFIFSGDKGQSKSCNRVSKQRKYWQTDKNTMLNCQNVSIFKKMLYCLFLFGLLDLRPGNASKFFLNLDKNLFGSLYLCDCSLRVTTDGDLEPVTHKNPLDHPLHTSWPMGSLEFQHTETVCKRLQIECHPCRHIFPFPPHLSFFFSVPQFSPKWACSQAKFLQKFQQ